MVNLIKSHYLISITILLSVAAISLGSPISANATLSNKAYFGTKFIVPSKNDAQISNYPYTIKWEPKSGVSKLKITLAKESSLEKEDIYKELATTETQFTPPSAFWPKDGSAVLVTLETDYAASDKPNTRNMVRIISKAASDDDSDNGGDNKASVITSPKDGDIITKSDFKSSSSSSTSFKGKLHISWDKSGSTNVKRYVLTVKGTDMNREALSSSHTEWMDLNDNFWATKFKRFRNTISSSKDFYDVPYIRWPKTNYVAIRLETQFKEGSPKVDGIIVSNDETIRENKRIEIKSPTNRDEVREVPTVKFLPGTNVKSAKIRISETSDFKENSTFEDNIDINKMEYKIDDTKWPVNTRHVYIQIESSFSTGKNQQHIIYVRNSVKDSNGSFNPITISEPTNLQEISPSNFPLTIRLNNGDENMIKSAKALLYNLDFQTKVSDIDNDSNSSIIKVNNISPYKTITLSEAQIQNQKFDIPKSSWKFSKSYTTILIQTKFKNNATKENFVTVKNVGDSDNNFAPIITAPALNRNVYNLPLEIRWDYAINNVTGYRIEVYTTDIIASGTTCRKYNSNSSSGTDCRPNSTLTKFTANVSSNTRGFDLLSSHYSLPTNKIMVFRVCAKYNNSNSVLDANCTETYVKSKPNET